jgi:tyrosine-protein phosphatase SIW14
MRIDHASFMRRRAAALLVSCALLGPFAARNGYAAASSGVPIPATIRIDNFGRIDEHYYRGSQPKGQDYNDLAALGVKTLIDLTSGDADATEASMAAKAGLKYVRIPMTTHQPPTPEQLAQFMTAVLNPANQPVYVHCVGGRHRTGVMTAVYRMVQDKWTPNQAFNEMKQYRFGADFLHAEFKKFVYGFRPDTLHLAADAASAATRTGS